MEQEQGEMAPNDAPSPGQLYEAEADDFISPALVFLLTNPTRRKIVAVLQDRAMTPAEYEKQFGGQASKISRHCKALVRWGWLEKVGRAPGRGRSNQRYRAAKPFHIDTKTWQRLPISVRTTVSGEIINELGGRVVEAMEAGTIDAKPDRHLSWAPLLLDGEAWGQLVVALDQLLLWVMEDLGPQATERLSNSDEQPITATIGLAAFLSPNPSRLDGRPAKWVK